MTDKYTGLSLKEIDERIRNHKFNTISKAYYKSITEIVIENSINLFNLVNFVLILIITGFYLIYHDTRLFLDSLGIGLAIIFNTIIAITQEIKAAKDLNKISLLQIHTAKVKRNSQETIINQSEIVIDEILKFQAGDEIPIDCIILESNGFEVDESLLTGESHSIEKTINDEILSGSFCVAGFAIAQAIRVGVDCHVNEINKDAKAIKFNHSPLIKKVNKLFFGTVILALVIVFIELSLSIRTNSFDIEELRKLITIAFTLIPEGMIFFATISYITGVVKVAKKGVLVQRINALDTLSEINILCLDKTGTLTENNLSISSIKYFKYKDFTNCILHNFAIKSGIQNQTISALKAVDNSIELKVINQIPFSSENKFSIIQFEIEGATRSFILGSPDILVNLVNDRNELENNINISTLSRNILLSEITNSFDIKIVNLNDLIIEPIALVSLKDKLRDDANEIINHFQERKIVLKILSGDSLDSIISTLENTSFECSNSISQKELEECDEVEFSKAVHSSNIFYRLSPKMKAKIINALKDNKHSVGFIGDGVNDINAMKVADVSIAMAAGSDIAKTVSDVVLLSNQFSILPELSKGVNRIINAVQVICNLFFIKIILVSFLSVFSWIHLLPYPLTPRSSYRYGLLTVALPSLLVPFFLNYTTKYIDFIKNTLKSSLLVSLILSFVLFTEFTYLLSFQSDLSSSVGVIYNTLLFCSLITAYFVIKSKTKQNVKKLFFIFAIVLSFTATMSVIEIHPAFTFLIEKIYEFKFISIKELIISLLFASLYLGVLNITNHLIPH
ncbi:MAG: HAD-IC family P-type ATPase [Candidatus Kapabacteria bacterium]|nr:HAD-IC family P-type ATPase [Candidatus Kapabacteria bacterium]